MELDFQNPQNNKIAQLISDILEVEIENIRHIHGGNTITFETASSDSLTTVDEAFNLLPTCQFIIHLTDRNRQLFIPRANGKTFNILWYKREDGCIACSFRRGNYSGEHQRYQGTLDEAHTFATNVARAIRFFLQWSEH